MLHTGALNSCSSAALDAILNFTPLDITLKTAPIMGAYRLKLNNNMGQARTHTQLDPYFSMPFGSFFTVYKYEKNAISLIGKIAKGGGGLLGKGLVWFTYGWWRIRYRWRCRFRRVRALNQHLYDSGQHTHGVLGAMLAKTEWHCITKYSQYCLGAGSSRECRKWKIRWACSEGGGGASHLYEPEPYC